MGWPTYSASESTPDAPLAGAKPVRDALEHREVLRDRLQQLDKQVDRTGNDSHRTPCASRPDRLRCSSTLLSWVQYLPAELPLPQALLPGACNCQVCRDSLNAVFVDGIFKFKHVRRAAGEASLVAHELLVPETLVRHFQGDDEVRRASPSAIRRARKTQTIKRMLEAF